VTDGPIVVTGASGFIGGHLVRALGASGPVRAILRTPAEVPGASEVAVVPDLRDRAALEVALEGARAVIHAAGRAHVLRETSRDPLQDFRRANVDTTRALYAAAAAQGLRRLVLLSSVSVFGRGGGARLDEHTIPAPDTPYGISRLEAEQVIAGESADSVAGTILRLPLVYGPGMKGNPLRLFRLVDRGMPLPLGGVHNLRSLLYVGNLVAAVAAVLEPASSVRGRFLVADAKPVSTPGLVRLIAAALGRPARLWAVPQPLLRVAARTGDVLSALIPVPFGSDALARLTASLVLETSALTRATGFIPPATVEEGIALTATWYRQRDADRP
jgi:nucleoside-diphosphate-sugar epimerase